MLRFWIVLIGVVVLLGTPRVGAADWPQWRGPQRDGVDAQSPPLIARLPAGGLQPVWMTATEIPSGNQGGWSSPVVAGDRVYLFVHRRSRLPEAELGPVEFPYLPPDQRTGMTDEQYREYERDRRDEQERRSKSFRFNEILHCFDRTSGDSIWSTERDSVYTRFAHSGTPWVGEDRLIVMGAGRRLLCFALSDGELIWETELPGEFRDEHFHSSVAVADQTAGVYLDGLFGVDVQSGEFKWQIEEERGGQPFHSSPAVWQSPRGPIFICNTPQRDTIAVEPSSGTELWRVTAEAGPSSPVVVGDRLLTYGRTRRGGLRCFQLSLEGAEELWRYQQLADPGSSPLVLGDDVFVQGDRRMACLRLSDGETRWSTRLDMTRPRYTSMVGGAGKVFYAVEGLLGWSAGTDGFEPLMNAKINRQGRMADEQEFRRELKLDELPGTVAGQREADRIWRSQFDQAGPLPCATPALVDGFLFVRLTDRLACYDLRASHQGGE